MTDRSERFACSGPGQSTENWWPPRPTALAARDPQEGSGRSIIAAVV